MARTAMILGAAAMALGALTAQADTARTVTVEGRGEVSAPPDMARTDFGVVARAATAGEAWAAAATAAGAVIAAAGAAGVAAADLQTVELSLSPVYAGGGDAPLRIEAYEARQRLSATVRDLDGLGPLLDAATAAGAVEVGGVAFDLSDREARLDVARARAVADAARVGALLAEAAGARLGAPLSIEVGGGFGPRPMMRAAAMDAMPVAPGAVGVAAQVTVVYALE